MNAQTYLDHLKQKNPGQGVVTVHQSKAIDELVNGKQVPTNTNQVNPQDDKTKTTPQPQKKPTDTQHKEVTPAAQHKQTPDSHKQTPDSLKKAEPQHETAKEKQHGNNAQKAENTSGRNRDACSGHAQESDAQEATRLQDIEYRSLPEVTHATTD